MILGVKVNVTWESRSGTDPPVALQNGQVWAT